MLYPMEPGIVRTFARGLEEVLVVEEKRGFVELLLREALYDLPTAPASSASVTRQGRPWCTRTASSTPIWSRGWSPAAWTAGSPSTRSGRGWPSSRPRASDRLADPGAPPYFCSGCPHNRSTVVPEGSMAAGGIGCHGLAMNMGRNVIGITQMGGEGAQWVGLAPFVDVPHLFQQLGDGTLFHSGSLAIRQAVAAGTRMTSRSSTTPRSR
jgi:indolepyruvate ferredoxin oxidoreductase